MKQLYLFPILLFAIAMCGCLLPDIADEYSIKCDIQTINNGAGIRVVNNNSWMWKETILEANGTYSLKVGTIREGAIRIITLRDFTDDQGKRYDPVTQNLNTLSIVCKSPDGKVRSIRVKL